LHRLRVVKSQREVALFRRACELTEAEFRRVFNFIKPGVNEMQVDAEQLIEKELADLRLNERKETFYQ
jgi:Xaa-Pro aminopeptidase